VLDVSPQHDEKSLTLQQGEIYIVQTLHAYTKNTVALVISGVSVGIRDGKISRKNDIYTLTTAYTWKENEKNQNPGVWYNVGGVWVYQ